ncbi:MAG: hypothetical protein Q9166_003304 [cf. Caloplaca sp. 2 TL-2023]
MEVSVSAALGHIQTFMHPQVVITDDQSREDGFFIKAIRSKANELGKGVIELPTDASENMMWITRLDSGSLAAWQTAYVDILIHAPPYSSGSLLRLLKSIEAADYFGHRRPHLTIELPAELDPPTMKYLEELVWPPVDPSGAPHVSQVTLRHRIPRRTSTVEEASVRLVESFYPAKPASSHVLVLSPQVELSPIYFHFLMYQLLEYKYSSTAFWGAEVGSLMGISLELPSLHLNDSNLFSPPMIRRSLKGSEDTSEEPTPFLWQAPNSNAALYFGNKWVEFHSFLKARVSLDPVKTPERPNLISESYPSWLEYILELMRARGYTLLYPNFPSGREVIASIHYELFHPPEEFTKPRSMSPDDTPVPTLDPKETFDTDPSSHKPKHSESTPLTTNLISLLPTSGSVQDLSNLPLLSHQGNEISMDIFEAIARSFTSDFRRQVGLCPATHRPKVESMKADDLFCDRGDEKVGMGLREDFDSDQPFAWKPHQRTPVVKDDSEIRQSEFEAHLSRQAGKKGEVGGRGNGKVGEEGAKQKADKQGGEKSEKSTGEDDQAGTKGSAKNAAVDEVEEGDGLPGAKIEDTKDGTEKKTRGTEKAGKDDRAGRNWAKTEDETEKPLARDRGW